ncbi:HDOD domain-containing protein [Alteromonas sp. CYL-A6]|uniref:HDOD domain-containing protein n=1 Tax=Alteromonas nitratireducens TaxID=3390813 RepID=UPI0034B06301
MPDARPDGLLRGIDAIAAGTASQPPAELINQALVVSGQVLDYCHADPDPALAFFACRPVRQSTTIKQLRALILLTLTCRTDKLNEHTLLHLVAATLLTLVTGHDNAREIHKKLRNTLRERGLTLWISILRLGKALSHPQGHQLLSKAGLRHFPQRVLSLCHLALVYDAVPPSACLRSYLNRARSDSYPLYSHWPLLPAGPLCGQVVHTIDERAGVVIAVRQCHLAVVYMEDGRKSLCVWLERSQVRSSQRPPVTFDKWLALYAAHEDDLQVEGTASLFPTTYPVHRPPVSLTSIIDALASGDTDVGDISALIDKEPAFSHFLLQSASHDNRMQLQVSSIKQAILTYGLERVGDMLVRHALFNRLTQHHFPLEAVCAQFATLMATIASCLAELTVSRFTPQSAALVATFYCAPLFTLPGLKVYQRLPLAQAGYYDPNQFLQVKQSERWQDLAGELASGWHQSASWRAILHHAGKPAATVPASLRREHCILQLAFIWTRQWLYGEGKPSDELNNILQGAQETLSVGVSEKNTIRHQVTDQLYCVLPR